MGQFTVTSVAYGDAITTNLVNSIISSAKTAFNRLNSSNFPAGCVPLMALKAPSSVFYVSLSEHGTVSSTVALTTRASTATGYFPLPASITVTGAAVIVGSFVGAATVFSIQVRTGSTTTVAYGTITVGASAAKTYKALALKTTNITANALVELRYGLAGAGRSAHNIVVVLKCKKNLSS